MKPDDWVISQRTNLCRTMLNCSKCCIMGRAVLLNRNTIRQSSGAAEFFVWLDPMWFSLAISFVEYLLAFGVDIMDCVTSACFCVVYSLFLLMLQIKLHIPRVLSLMEIYAFLKVDRTHILRTAWEVCQSCASVLLPRVWFSTWLVGFWQREGKKRGRRALSGGSVLSIYLFVGNCQVRS